MKDQLTINRARVTKRGNDSNGKPKPIIEKRLTQDGRNMAIFKIMWSSSKKDAAGQWENGPTKFITVKAFDYLAIWAEKHLDEGSLVSLQGSIAHFEWQSNNGPREGWEMFADFIAPYTPRQQNNQQGAWGQGNQANWGGDQNAPQNQAAQQPAFPTGDADEPPF